MSKSCCKKGMPIVALFSIAFGAGMLSGVALVIILLEVRERVHGLAESHKRGLPDYMLDVAGDFTLLSDDIVNEIAESERSTSSNEQTVQGLKTRIRHGGSLNESKETMEMSALYDAINPDED